ncbi:MAG: CCA tRNA nucleotidyltransferase [Thaumarchaeota archaeon]|nr:MAG: CCA tRNA nucleotidyltransferase [Nitrososphaerota archaeon]
MSYEKVLEKALRLVKPSRSEERKLKKIVEEALNIAKEESRNFSGIVDISLEGSVAKNTWIKNRAEADVFVHFSREVSREELEKKIVDLGTRIIERLGGKPMLMYADHPYVEGGIDNVTIDIVACYKTEPPNWISATDRTPYHTRYVLERLKPGQEDDVRLLKGFMMACGVYGAEIKVRGFSGYLTELLVIGYGGFLEVLKRAAGWKPPVILDLEGYYSSREELLEIFRGNPLIVIDPVDRSRNVAAAVSMTKLSEFILASRLFLENPSIKFFKEPSIKVRTKDILKLARERHILYIFFRLREYKPRDVIWGELRRSEEGVRKALERLGFKVYRSASWTDENKKCILLFELNKLSLPRYMLHQGPPVYLRNALDFLEKWSRRGVGPWIQGDRLYVLKRNEETYSKTLLKKEIKKGAVAVSRDLLEYFRKASIGTDLRSLTKMVKKDEYALRFLYEFLKARPRFLMP